MHDLEIIGISGKAGSGKDFISQRFFVPNGYAQFSLAWHFKVWAVGQGKATHDEVFHTKPPHIRKILQEEGTERGRNIYGEDVWVNTMLAWMNVLNEYCGIYQFIVPDVRFKNEAAAIQKAGGKVFRIIAPERSAQSALTPEQRLHPSELDLDEYSQFDGYIYNDPKYAETVARQMSILLNDAFVTDAPDTEEPDSGWFDEIKKWFTA